MIDNRNSQKQTKIKMVNLMKIVNDHCTTKYPETTMDVL